jgi:high-affinity Fe2+/Pb2+ permease
LFAFAVGGRGGAGLAIAGGITTVTGLVLAFQNATGLWATWAYAWALVAPGGAGLGLLLYGLFTRQPDFVARGRGTLLVGIVLFVGFAIFFEGFIGLSGDRLIPFDTALPLLLVGIGGLLVVSSLIGRRRGGD